MLTRQLAHPPRGGAALRTWQTINLLAELGEVSVASVIPGARDLAAPPRVAHWRLIGETAAPHGAKQSLWARARASAWLLDRQGHRDAASLFTKPAASVVRELVERAAADLVVFEELWLYPYLRALNGWRGAIIYNAHNVEGLLRDTLPRLHTSRYDRLVERLLSVRTRAAERRLCRYADGIWVCSETDARAIRDLYGHALPVSVVPNAVDIRAYDAVPAQPSSVQSAGDATPLTILFPAAFGYAPNADAADWLVQEILPHVRRQVPDARLLLVGRSPGPALHLAAARDTAIEVTDEVPDMKPYFARADVVIAPLRFGGGTRLKILEAFAARRPVVCTSKAAEGLEAVSGTHLLMAESPADLASAVVRLGTDQALRNGLTQAAYDLVCSTYSWEVVGKAMTAAIDSVRLAPPFAGTSGRPGGSR